MGTGSALRYVNKNFVTKQTCYINYRVRPCANFASFLSTLRSSYLTAHPVTCSSPIYTPGN